MIISVCRWGVANVGIVMTLWLSGCASSSHPPAPVEDRTPPAPPAAAAAPATAGVYRVKPGDTLTRIALDHGQSWRDLARWNQLSNPDRIEVGQMLRVSPPEGAESSSAVVVTPVAEPPVAPASSSISGSSGSASAAVPAASPASAPASAPASTPAPARPATDLVFAWPAQGAAIAGFDEVRNKGIDIAGKAGDPVLAAADGQVVYAGAGLRGYGNLIIVKHNATYLTAYAHNQRLLVQEDQRVRQGQKIAEMGSSDADRVKLHFEIRRNGKPVDPVKLLPAR
jgi:lipoprotein NlpD